MTLRYRLHDARDAVSVTEASHTRARVRNNRRTTPSAFGLGAFFVSAVKLARVQDSVRAGAFIALPLSDFRVQTSSLLKHALNAVSAAWLRRALKSARRSLATTATQAPNLRAGTTEF